MTDAIRPTDPRFIPPVRPKVLGSTRPDDPPESDVVVMESTYGYRNRKPSEIDFSGALSHEHDDTPISLDEILASLDTVPEPDTKEFKLTPMVTDLEAGYGTNESGRRNNLLETIIMDQIGRDYLSDASDIPEPHIHKSHFDSGDSLFSGFGSDKRLAEFGRQIDEIWDKLKASGVRPLGGMGEFVTVNPDRGPYVGYSSGSPEPALGMVHFEDQDHERAGDLDKKRKRDLKEFFEKLPDVPLEKLRRALDISHGFSRLTYASCTGLPIRERMAKETDWDWEAVAQKDPEIRALLNEGFVFYANYDLSRPLGSSVFEKEKAELGEGNYRLSKAYDVYGNLILGVGLWIRKGIDSLHEDQPAHLIFDTKPGESSSLETILTLAGYERAREEGSNYFPIWSLVGDLGTTAADIGVVPVDELETPPVDPKLLDKYTARLAAHLDELQPRVIGKLSLDRLDVMIQTALDRVEIDAERGDRIIGDDSKNLRAALSKSKPVTDLRERVSGK